MAGNASEAITPNRIQFWIILSLPFFPFSGNG
jgi:hypothetical protein